MWAFDCESCGAGVGGSLWCVSSSRSAVCLLTLRALKLFPQEACSHLELTCQFLLGSAMGDTASKTTGAFTYNVACTHTHTHTHTCMYAHTHMHA